MLHSTRSTFLLLALVAALPLYAGEPLAPPPILDYTFHAVQPLGTDSFVIEGQKQTIGVLASAISPDIDGWTRVKQGGKLYVLGRDGERIRAFPNELQFRVTVSTLTRVVTVQDPATVTANESVNDYLLHVRFRLKIFHELHSRTVEPLEVHMMGVPSDVNYDERIYRVSFKLPRVPISDRMILELLSPEGDRITKFHFELM